MINTSKEYKEYIRDARMFYHSAEITLADSTVHNLNNAHIKSMKIDNGTSQNGAFTIGSAIIGKLTLSIDNMEEAYSDNDFVDAVIRPSIGLQLSSTIETLIKGVFTVDDPQSVGSTMTITAMDNMIKFNVPFSEVEVNFPCTNLQLIQAICLHCGVSLATVSFTNWDYVINERPVDEALTCRDMISSVAQTGGNFARCNNQGALELKWYDFKAFETEDNIDGGKFDESMPYATGDNADGGNFIDYTSGDDIDGGTFLNTKRFHHIYSLKSLSIATDDVVVTGIQVTYNAEKSPITTLYGTSGYILAMNNNPLIQSQSDAQSVANTVGTKIVGMRFRPLTVSAQSDPSIEEGDIAKVSDRKGNVYHTLITNLSYSSGSNETFTCDAESPARNSSTRYSAETKTIIQARKEAQKQITAYDLAVQQLNDLVLHSFGVYKSEELLPDGSKIFYSHDKPTLAESQNIWKQTANTFTVSNDGGQTWRGMDADGNMLATVLNAIGVNAEWINVLTSFNVGENFSVDSFGILKATDAEISGKIMADNGKIGPYTIDGTGMFADQAKFFIVDGLASLRLSRSGLDGGTFKENSYGSEEANYQTGKIEYDTISGDGVKTHLEIMSGDNSVSPNVPKISILTLDAATDEPINYMEFSPQNGVSIDKYENGEFSKNITVSPDNGVDIRNADGDWNYFNEGQLCLEYNGNNASITLGDNELDITADEIFISANKVTISGEKYTEM